VDHWFGRTSDREARKPRQLRHELIVRYLGFVKFTPSVFWAGLIVVQQLE
jgi:hypothetical protein